MNNILVYSAVIPNKDNRGGPTGLIWEFLEVFKEYGFHFHIEMYKNEKKYNKLGVFFKKNTALDYKKFEQILVYPSYLIFSLPRKERKKAIVLGPDASTLLYARFEKNSSCMRFLLRSIFLKKWFYFYERFYLSSCNKNIVVGKNDSRWLKAAHSKFKDKISYLTHPVLSSIKESMNNRDLYERSQEKKILVFSGDMSKKYVGAFFEDFADLVSELQNDILIVGKNNLWIYELFLSKDKLNVIYKPWVDDYSDICNPFKHVHVAPIIAGAGTKNRSISACALGVPLLSTSIGYENICYGKPVNINYRIKCARDVVDIIDSISPSYDKQKLIEYVNRVNSRFELEILKIFRK
ncbi:MAG: hypothetical protein IE909_10355 [Campylobacterales bacterium]|nr:hypothetical protein [Campylobacterales bacterium]